MIEKVNDIITTLPNNMTQRTVANSRIFLTALENTVQNGTSEAVDGHVSSVEPSGADRSRNTCYYGNGLTFPPVDAPQDFLKAIKDSLFVNSVGYKWLIYCGLCCDGASFATCGQRRAAA